MLGDVYLVTVQGTYRSQQVVNTFTYEQVARVVDGISDAQHLLNAFDLQFFVAGLGLRNGAFSNKLSYQATRAQNLYSVADFGEIIYSPPIVCPAASEAMPNFVAYGFRTQWLGGVVRRGFKRFAGVVEAVVDEGVLNPATLALMDDLAFSMSENLVEAGNEFRPVIVGRFKEVDPVTGAVTYRLPNNVGETPVVGGLTWAALPLVTTQSSRKIGRGA